MDSGSVPGREGAGRSSVETYILALAAFAAALAASWVYWYGVESGPRVVLVAALFGGFILLSSAFPIRVSDRWSIGTWDIGLMLAIVVLGPFWAAVAALPAAFLVGRGDPLRTTYEASLSTIAVFLAGMVFSLVSAPLLTGSPASPAPALYGAFTAAVVLLAVIHAVNAGLLRVKYGQGLEQTWRELVEPYLISDAVNVLTAGIGVLA
ncbi:MAG: hypothetical protein H0V53_13840, partial [Rubrobacter sp.]|nr:hypothetical protein [Rubrobacter sp.]